MQESDLLEPPELLSESRVSLSQQKEPPLPLRQCLRSLGNTARQFSIVFHQRFACLSPPCRYASHRQGIGRLFLRTGAGKGRNKRPPRPTFRPARHRIGMNERDRHPGHATGRRPVLHPSLFYPTQETPPSVCSSYECGSKPSGETGNPRSRRTENHAERSRDRSEPRTRT